MKKCPKCKLEYKRPSAISRLDNKQRYASYVQQQNQWQYSRWQWKRNL